MEHELLGFARNWYDWKTCQLKLLFFTLKNFCLNSSTRKIACQSFFASCLRLTLRKCITRYIFNLIIHWYESAKNSSFLFKILLEAENLYNEPNKIERLEECKCFLSTLYSKPLPSRGGVLNVTFGTQNVSMHETLEVLSIGSTYLLERRAEIPLNHPWLVYAVKIV